MFSDRVQIQGVWGELGSEWKPSGAEKVAIRQNPSGAGAQIIIYPKNPRPGVEWPAIEPLFEYPSDRNLGELRNKKRQ